MSARQNVYDVLGVGFGPANLSLAIVMEELGFPYSVRFLEKEAERTAIWQREMLIEHSDIQNHPLRDLVTPRNPRSRYSFVNYLFENDRLFEHLNLGMNFPYRIEYAGYLSWVAKHFRRLVSYDTFIDRITMEEQGEDRPPAFCVHDASGARHYARCVVVAPGRTPYIPRLFQALHGSNVCHVNNFLSSMDRLKERKKAPRICVVGGSQSAVEIILHLSENYPDASITGILRNYGYRQKDCSPFTGEVYFPAFVDLYYHSTPENRRRLTKDLYYTHYSAADIDVLDRLYRKIYLQKLTGRNAIEIHRLSEILEVRQEGAHAGVLFKKLESEDAFHESFDLVVLATGFRNMGPGENEELYPGILEGIRPHFNYSDGEGLIIGHDYKLRLSEGVHPDLACYINGLCESTHGMGDAGSFSLLALRAQIIADSLKKVLTSAHREDIIPV